jgi:hypothetical protein
LGGGLAIDFYVCLLGVLVDLGVDVDAAVLVTDGGLRVEV